MALQYIAAAVLWVSKTCETPAVCSINDPERKDGRASSLQSVETTQYEGDRVQQLMAETDLCAVKSSLSPREILLWHSGFTKSVEFCSTRAAQHQSTTL